MPETLPDATDNDKRDPLDFVRASGECLCEDCGAPFRKHPFAKEIPGYDGHPFLRRLCCGTLVKL